MRLKDSFEGRKPHNFKTNQTNATTMQQTMPTMSECPSRHLTYLHSDFHGGHLSNGGNMGGNNLGDFCFCS